MRQIWSDEHYQFVASHYGVDLDLLKAEKAIYTKSVTDHTHLSGSQATAVGVVETGIFATIHATSCSAERSFSGLRQLKTYLRSTMGQTRLNSVAILNIERKYVNVSVGKNVDKIIDIFAARKGRKQYFF